MTQIQFKKLARQRGFKVIEHTYTCSVRSRTGASGGFNTRMFGKDDIRNLTEYEAISILNSLNKE
jgi:hypothetical protein